MGRLFPCLLVASSLVCTPAAAYVLPSPFLMRMLIDQRQDQKTGDLSIELASEDLTTSTSVDERLYLKQARRMRLVEEGDDGRVVVEREGACAEGNGERLKRTKCAQEALLALLLVPGTTSYDELSAAMVEALKKAGLDTTVVALGRDPEQRFIYIVGARPWEPEKPQLWLLRGSFMPVRLRAKTADNGTYELRLLNWGSEVGGNWFPGVLEEYRNDKLVRRSEVTKIQANQNLPESMFAIP